ncbi:putative lipoprotein [Pseudomonas aeruginosa]|nr:hypothetical protein Y880_05771 [Pseudomonas aeruginosa PAK]AVK22610.1 putative lipoprotein [Pseudomonas aeruginosa]EYU02891.1 hypothetical protein PA103_4938 [Pseudomonas aeruginosa PA103]AWF60726.1 putative lipoprotein [Pseudomonas aeruginosa]AWF64295.1 putative lipoprotein [Pseudomonas aeruginosa]
MGLRATVFHGWACSGECRVGHRAWLRVQPARRCNYLTTRTTPLKPALLRAAPCRRGCRTVQRAIAWCMPAPPRWPTMGAGFP